MSKADNKFILLNYTPYFKKREPERVWWCTLVILALIRLKQVDLGFKANLGYILRL
jgi:hypothetical protein